MKSAIVCFAISLLVCLTGCSHESDRIGGAPRTVSASSAAGWKEVSTSGIAFRLPSDWKIIDQSKGSFDEAMEKAFGNDPKFAAMRNQASAMAKQGMIKLLAFETSTAGSGFNTNCNVVALDSQGQTLEQIANSSVQQISTMVANGTQPKLEYITLKSGKTALIRSEIKTPNPAVPNLISLAYVSVKGSKLAVVTFSTAVSQETHIQPISSHAMETFRFTN